MPRENPFKPAADVAPRFKVFIYGATGTGKTYFALNAPGRVAIIDTEGGSALYPGMVPEFDRIETKSFREVIEAIDYIDANPGVYGTLVVDPISVIYETLQDAALKARIARNSRKGGPTEDVELEIRDWGTIKRNLKSLMNRLANVRCHVIVTAREKEDNVLKGGEMVKMGVKADAERSTAYYFDCSIRLSVKGDTRIATVEKARGVLGKALTLGSQYTDPTFESLFGPLLAGEKEPKGKASAKPKPKAERAVVDDEAASSKDARVFGEEIASEEMVAEFVAAMDSLGFDAETVRQRRNWPPFNEMPAATLAEALAKLKVPSAPAPRLPSEQNEDVATSPEYVDIDDAPSKATN